MELLSYHGVGKWKAGYVHRIFLHELPTCRTPYDCGQTASHLNQFFLACFWDGGDLAYVPYGTRREEMEEYIELRQIMRMYGLAYVDDYFPVWGMDIESIFEENT